MNGVEFWHSVMGDSDGEDEEFEGFAQVIKIDIVGDESDPISSSFKSTLFLVRSQRFNQTYRYSSYIHTIVLCFLGCLFRYNLLLLTFRLFFLIRILKHYVPLFCFMNKTNVQTLQGVTG